MVAKHPILPPSISRTRSLVNSLRFVKNPIPVLNEYTADCGDTYSFYVGGGAKRGIVSTNPKFIQHVLQKNHRNYQKSAIQVESLGHFVGNGLLTSNGDYWLRQRRLIQPGFHKTRLALLVGIMLEVIEKFLSGLEAEMKLGAPIDIHRKMMELAFRIVAKSLFSNDLEEEKLQQLRNNISIIQKFIVRQVRQPYLNPWFKLSGQLRKCEELAAESDQLILRFIRERRETGGSYDDLLQMLLDARYEDTGKGMTDKQLLDESVILYIAGHETTANALAWTWYLLSRHPESVEKIRKEAGPVLEAGELDFSSLAKLEYTLQVIEESLRLYPPAWITDREASEDDHVIGFDVPKGTLVLPFIYGTHHSPAYWQEPERFIPERFSKENKKNLKPFSYLPFGGGPRLCIGNNFALMEMQLILAKMVCRYDFELLPQQVIEPQPLITLRPKYGIKMHFWKR